MEPEPAVLVAVMHEIESARYGSPKLYTDKNGAFQCVEIERNNIQVTSCIVVHGNSCNMFLHLKL